MNPSETYQAHAKHLERVAAWLYDRAVSVDRALVSLNDCDGIALTAHQTADTLDKLARDLREYATLYAGRIP